jgi:hypothetical protein
MSLPEYYREIGWTAAIKYESARLRCRLTGHKWERKEDWDCYDEGACVKTDEWWECSRCERFTWDRP